MTEPVTLLDALIKALRQAGAYNSSDGVAPAAILWPDKEGQWLPLLPALRAELPLLTLGEYAPEILTGPAYWLRCALAHTLPDVQLPPDAVPILYLPGIGKQEIRAVETCPRLLQPLAELQYRGVLWTQRNGRDWTIAAFLQNKEGLQLPVAGDNATKEALLRALPVLAKEPRNRLHQHAPLQAETLDALLNPDDVRRLLLWMNDPQAYPATLDAATWTAFCNLCVGKYGFHPKTDGPVAAAQLLGKSNGPWQAVWQRYCEASTAYPNLPQLLRRAKPSVQPTLFDGRVEYWPQDNEVAEAELRNSLLGLFNGLPDPTRQTLRELEAKHGARREWVWAKLGATPLADALVHLVRLAGQSEQPLTGHGLAALAEQYTAWGWQVDAAVLAALQAVRKDEDVQAVQAALRPLYQPWLQHAALAFQTLYFQAGAPSLGDHQPDTPQAKPGTCYLFVDALRYDVGQGLVALLEARQLACRTDWRLAALPTVTSTAKPAISPVAAALNGNGRTDLTPVVVATGTPVNAVSLRKLLADAGYQILTGSELGDPTGRGWTEIGAIDQYGHQHGWKIAHRIQEELQLLQERIIALLAHGWQQVVILTDHGWLLLPGNLPKQELPIHVTHLRKGRCAVLRAGAQTDQQSVPWHWDTSVRVAQATGLACFEDGKAYEHGGLSPQECVIPVLTVSAGARQDALPAIQDVAWRGLRCTVTWSHYVAGLIVDIRTQAANPATSLVNQPKMLEEDGTVSLLVADEDTLGMTAILVALAADGTIQMQASISIGG